LKQINRDNVTDLEVAWTYRTGDFEGKMARFGNSFGLQSDAWRATLYVRNLLEDDTPIGALGFSNFAINPIITNADAPNNGAYPRPYSIVPQRGRDFGIEFQYRFGR